MIWRRVICRCLQRRWNYDGCKKEVPHGTGWLTNPTIKWLLMNNIGQGYAEFALLPHAQGRERMDQAALSLQQVTGLSWWTSHCSTGVPQPLWAHEACSVPACKAAVQGTGRAANIAGQVHVSLQGWGSQDSAYSEPEKQLFWRTLLRLEFCGVTQVVQKCTALKPGKLFFFFFFWSGAHQLAPNVLPACLDCLSLPASTTCRMTPHPFPLPRAHFTYKLLCTGDSLCIQSFVLLTNKLCSKGWILLVNLHGTGRSQHTEGSPSCFGSMKY